ncbi:MAG TPA: nucleotidyltransferase domain-containing protein [Vicinamibacteria bacterium]|jgi:hypothetical protein
MDSGEIRHRLKHFFAKAPEEVVAVYVFGSHARGSADETSDVDVAVLFREIPERSLDGPPFRLRGELENLLHRSVDLVVLNDASPDLCHRVFRDGMLVLDRDRAFRIRFEVKRRNEYLDFLPVLRRYRRYPKGRIAR